MSFTFINPPFSATRSEYDQAIAAVVQQLQSAEGLLAIYRFGNITSPGISDIDLLAVFENETRCEMSGFEKLPTHLRKLFTHGVMALSKKHFLERNQFTIWSEDHLVWGNTIKSDSDELPSQDELIILKRQIAIEYLLINYIDLRIQTRYQILNLRSSLQHFKGVVYDLDFLSIGDHPLRENLLIIKKWYAEWFTNPPSKKEIEKWMANYTDLLIPFLNAVLKQEPLYLPEKNIYQLAKNITLSRGNDLCVEHNGFLFPSVIAALLEKKYVKFLNKINSFHFEAAITHTTDHPVLINRMAYLKEMVQYNAAYLPNFMPISTMISSKL